MWNLFSGDMAGVLSPCKSCRLSEIIIAGPAKLMNGGRGDFNYEFNHMEKKIITYKAFEQLESRRVRNS